MYREPELSKRVVISPGFLRPNLLPECINNELSVVCGRVIYEEARHDSRGRYSPFHLS